MYFFSARTYFPNSKVMFRMLDIDEDDFISQNDLVDFYRMMYIPEFRDLLDGNKLKDPKNMTRLVNDGMIQDLAKEMIRNFDIDGDKRLNYDEFKKVNALLKSLIKLFL